MRGTLKGPMPYNGLHFRLDRMDYLQLPLAVGYRFCPMPHFTLTPKIGGYVALGLKADGWIEGTTTNNPLALQPTCSDTPAYRPITVRSTALTAES